MRRVAASWLAGMLSVSGAAAQNYPSHTVRIIAPIAAGGATDILSRMIAHKLYESWGEIVQVDNRPGAGGVIGSDLVARAMADGYTLLMANTAHVTNPTLVPRLPYDTLNDFAPVTMVAIVPSVLLVHPSLPVRSVRELIAFAKARPGDLNCASSGVGTATHLSLMLFSHMTGAIIEHVPYRGGAPALYELVGGQVSLMFGNVASSMGHIRSRRLRALAVTSSRRSAALPNLPTMGEAGLPGFEAMAWFALLAPARTPGAVINKLNSEVVAILQLPEIRARLMALGAEVRPSTPGQLDDYIRTEIDKWSKVIKTVGVAPG